MDEYVVLVIIDDVMSMEVVDDEDVVAVVAAVAEQKHCIDECYCLICCVVENKADPYSCAAVYFL